MKKIIFWILIIIGTFLLLRIGKILVFDIKRLTEFGYGFLTGQVILFILILIATTILWNKTYKKS